MIYVLLASNGDGTYRALAWTDGIAEVIDLAMEKIAIGHPRKDLLIKRKLY